MSIHKEGVDLVVENSTMNLEIDFSILKSKENISEGTTESDIASTDSLIDVLVREIFPATIADKIASVQPLKGPSGHVISLGRKRDASGVLLTGTDAGLETKSILVNAESHIKTIPYSVESIQDIINLYKESGLEVLKTAILSTSIESTNKEVINFCKGIATDYGTITPDATNGFGHAISQLKFDILNMASKVVDSTKRGFFPYVVASPKVAMLLSGSYNFQDENFEDINFIGALGKLKIYVDFYAEDESILVGHKGELLGDAGVIMSPYQSQIYTSTDENTGQMKIFVNNRWKLTRNPSDKKTGNESDYFQKAIVDLSGLGI